MTCQCKFRVEGKCEMIADSAGLPIAQCPVASDACNACCETKARQAGEISYVVASLAIKYARESRSPNYPDILARLTPFLRRDRSLLSRYRDAVSRWLAAGRPVRSASETARILAICKSCKYYKKNRCQLCGCKLEGAFAGIIDNLTSKIAMATEGCPRGLWKPEITIDKQD